MRARALLTVVVAAAGLSGCGDDQSRGAAEEADRPRPVTTTTSAVEPAGELGRPMNVPATANIFGAGREEPPAPAGGGPGDLPPYWLLPGTADRVITFPKITGRISPITPAEDNSAAGDRIGPTDITSYRGISGIVHRRNGMFLVGVFLPDVELSDHAPKRLDFTKRARSGALRPRIGQTFLVGDGKRRSYHVPAGATRLYLGFADGYLYVGSPGWYGNNDGALSVTVRLTRAR
jgi:hypothetical protein